MMTAQQVFEAAAALAGELTAQQEHMLEALCGASLSSLSARLREGLVPEDCGDTFITAAALMALASLYGCTGEVPTEQITAGDFTIRKGTSSREKAVRCLTEQAEGMMVPYLKDRFSFRGV